MLALVAASPRWEAVPRFDRFSDHPVKAFYGVRRLDGFLDRWIETKERDHLLPGPASAGGMQADFSAHFSLKASSSASASAGLAVGAL